MYKKIGIIGLGLIGGSVARTIHKRYPGIDIIAVDSDSSNIDAAYTDGVISNDVSVSLEMLNGCDLIMLCAPVKTNVALLSDIKPIINDDCLITDVSSVKAVIEQAVSDIGLSSQFIGGHPMAGSEKTGYINSTDTLLENAYYLITNNGAVDSDKVKDFEDFIAGIGAIPLEMTPSQHDYVTGGISHIPHIISAGLVNFVMNNDDDKHSMKTVAAGGFKDITRISSSYPVMWQNVCLTNKDKILELLTCYCNELDKFRKAIEAEDSEAIVKLFSDAKEYRDSLNVNEGFSVKIYDFYLDVPDETGIIAKVATILADNNLSIRNIGIINNREYRDGALRIEMYDDKSRAKAINVLNANNYTVY